MIVHRMSASVPVGRFFRIINCFDWQVDHWAAVWCIITRPEHPFVAATMQFLCCWPRQFFDHVGSFYFIDITSSFILKIKTGCSLRFVFLFQRRMTSHFVFVMSRIHHHGVLQLRCMRRVAQEKPSWETLHPEMSPLWGSIVRRLRKRVLVRELLCLDGRLE